MIEVSCSSTDYCVASRIVPQNDRREKIHPDQGSTDIGGTISNDRVREPSLIDVSQAKWVRRLKIVGACQGLSANATTRLLLPLF